MSQFPNNSLNNENASMRLTLVGAKESRKRAELDAQLLANRIALLKQEEDKAWRKIEETKRKAKEILITRQQNEQRQAAREENLRQKQEQIRLTQAQNQIQRERTKQVRDQTKVAVLETKHQEAMSVKNVSMITALQKEEKDRKEKEIVNQKAEFLRKQKLEQKIRLQEEQKAKQMFYKKQFESKIAKEQILKARTEALVLKMEEEEMELINRLQNTQKIQRTAFDELENALGLVSKPPIYDMNKNFNKKKSAQLRV